MALYGRKKLVAAVKAALHVGAIRVREAGTGIIRPKQMRK